MSTAPRPDTRLPLYQRLRDEFAARIAAGEWRPGTAIPPEAELAGARGVALGTVRKAIEQLVHEGVVERQQGRGTFVRRADFGSGLFRFFRHTGAGGRPIHPEGRLLERRTAAAGDAAAPLGVGRGSRVLWLSRLRLVDGEPLLAEEIALPLPRFAPIAALPPDAFGDLLYPLYEREAGLVIARARERISFGHADAATARRLAIEPGDPVVVVDRVAYGHDGAPLEWRRSRGPAARFSYEIEIR